MRPRAPARGRKLRAERGPAYLCGQRPRFFLSQGEVLPAPILFSAAQPPRPFWAEPTSVGVRRREPVCQATGVYSIKRGPRCAARSGEQRERAAGAVQERTRQGDNRGISAEMQCGTASRAARDLTGEPCSPVNPFFLDGGFWLGESASRKPGGGVGGAFLLQEGQMASKPPTIFLWYRQAAPSLSKKEMVGPTVPHTECGFPVPRRARNPSSPAGESLVPRRARNCSLSAREPRWQVKVRKPIPPPTAWAPPFTHGRLPLLIKDILPQIKTPRCGRFLIFLKNGDFAGRRGRGVL